MTKPLLHVLINIKKYINYYYPNIVVKNMIINKKVVKISQL